MKAVEAEKRISSGHLDPVYVVYGLDTYWHLRLVSKISTFFTGGAQYLDAEELDWNTLWDMLIQPSFFGPSLWVVKNAEKLFAEEQPTGRISVAQGNSLVLLCNTKENPYTPEVVRLLQEAGCLFVEVSDPSFQEACEWVLDYMRSERVAMSDDAAKLMVSLVGRKIERLEMEASKLVLYSASPDSPVRAKITSQEVLMCVSPDPETNTFDLVDAIANRKAAKAYKELGELLSRGVNPILIVAVLGNHFMLLWRAKDARKKGITQDSAARVLGVHPYAAKKAMEQSNEWTYSSLEDALRILCRIDENLKRGDMDPVQAMDYLVAALVNL